MIGHEELVNTRRLRERRPESDAVEASVATLPRTRTLRRGPLGLVIAFGVAAMAIGLGVVNILLGWSLTRLAKR